MRFSVVTVCLNSESVLPRAIDSLARQRYTDYEWVVVDGGSSDSTLQLIEGFSAAPVVLLSGPDRGIYDAMNKGVAAASGDYVYFLNSDDVLADTAVLSDVAARLQTRPDLDMLFGNVIYVRPDSRVLRTFAHINTQTLLFEDLCHQAVFAKRSLFSRIGGFNETFRINADYDWLIRALSTAMSYEWFDRTIAWFVLGGAHAQDPAYLARERRTVRLQYASPLRLAVGELMRRLRSCFERHFKGGLRGQVPLE